MYNSHRFHFKIDAFLLEEIDKYTKKMNNKSREGTINWIFETMMPYINNEIMNSESLGFSDGEIFVPEEITVKIRDYNFDVIRFIRLRFHSFSFATILRHILRLFLILKNSMILSILKEIIHQNRDIKISATNFRAHMCTQDTPNNCTLNLNSFYQLLDMTIFYKHPKKLNERFT